MIKDSQQDEKSRSQVKRDFRALKELGIRLAGLSKGQLSAIPLSEKTRAAMLGDQLQPHVKDVASLHEAERLRDELRSGDERQLAAFVERYPGCDRTHVRLLVRNARK